MTIIDNRFSIETIDTLKSLINKQLKKIKHTAFFYRPAAYGIVGLFIGDDVYKITNFLEVQDYYGKQEDIAYFRFEPSQPSEIVSLLDDVEMIDFPIGGKIKEIRVVNENQRLYHNDDQTYDVYTVRGMIFVFDDGRELSFEKPVWFSEEIYIKKGYNLYDKFVSEEHFSEGWEGCDEYIAKCTREIVTIK